MTAELKLKKGGCVMVSMCPQRRLCFLDMYDIRNSCFKRFGVLLCNPGTLPL